MKSTLLWALVILNVVLVCTFLGRISRDNTVSAADAPPTPVRRMGDYLVIAGDVNGTASGLVYVVDTSNELLGAMAFDDTRGAIDVMPTIDLKHIFEQPVPAKAR
jgi:hypothetical protein